MTYTPDGRNVTAVTDARGNVTRTIYDDKNRLPKKTIDANGNEVRYTYDGNSDKLIEAVQTVGGEERKVRYTYELDDLKAIEHNGFTYSYTYDAYGNQKSVSVGAQELERTDYRNNNGLVDSVTYANGEKMVNEYDKEERLVSQHLVKPDGTSRRLYTNTYDNYEKLVRHEDHQNRVNITSRKEYLYTGECPPSVAKQYPYRYCYEYGKDRISIAIRGLSEIIVGKQRGKWSRPSVLMVTSPFFRDIHSFQIKRFQEVVSPL